MSESRRGLRKLVLFVHVTCSVGWLGSVLAFLALALAALTSADEVLGRGAYVAADLVLRLVIVPLALASVAGGVLSSLVSRWGLVRHYWVIAKLVLTTVATVVLLLQLEPIGAAARLAEASGTPRPGTAGMSMVVHAVGGIVVLLLATALAVYKPRGTTRFAARPSSQQAEADEALARKEPEASSAPMPRP
jgi:hypothetical protein